MSDYIKREDVWKMLARCFDGRAADIILEGVPSADVAPVRHGRWTLDTAHTEEIYAHPVKCSVCGRTEVLGYETLTPYCPNCGARMDEEVD